MGLEPQVGRNRRPKSALSRTWRCKGAVTTGAESEVKRPESWYADAAVVAFRLPENDQSMAALQPKVTSNGGNFDLAKLTDGDYADGTLLPPAPVGQKSWIQFEFQKPVTVYGMSMYLGDLNRGMMMRGGESSGKNLEASDDGKQLHAVSELPGGRMTIPDSRYRGRRVDTISFAPATAKFFRVTILTPKPTGPRCAGRNQYLGTEPCAPQDGSTASKTRRPSQPPPAFTRWRRLLLEATSWVRKGDVIDLTSQMQPDGTLNWNPPAGKWAVLRLGYSLIGTVNRGSIREATGLEVDKLNQPFTSSHYFDNYLDQYKGRHRRADGQARSPIM